MIRVISILETPRFLSASGKQITFDIPIPTVTGEDPNRLSTVFDEIVVKERILVEGGDSKQILSQFDGPVTFNSDVRLANPAKKFILESELRAQKAKFRDTLILIQLQLIVLLVF